eukprot:2597643-Pleurochrysis_carterae.AAC.3
MIPGAFSGAVGNGVYSQIALILPGAESIRWSSRGDRFLALKVAIEPQESEHHGRARAETGHTHSQGSCKQMDRFMPCFSLPRVLPPFHSVIWKRISEIKFIQTRSSMFGRAHGGAAHTLLSMHTLIVYIAPAPSTCSPASLITGLISPCSQTTCLKCGARSCRSSA